MRKNIWNNWFTDYLNQLQQMNEKELKNKSIGGDFVTVKEDNISVSKWPSAKITDKQKDDVKKVGS